MALRARVRPRPCSATSSRATSPSTEARERYGVVVRYVGPADALVRTHASYELDRAATAEARARVL